MQRACSLTGSLEQQRRARVRWSHCCLPDCRDVDVPLRPPLPDIKLSIVGGARAPVARHTHRRRISRACAGATCHARCPVQSPLTPRCEAASSIARRYAYWITARQAGSPGGKARSINRCWPDRPARAPLDSAAAQLSANVPKRDAHERAGDCAVVESGPATASCGTHIDRTRRAEGGCGDR